MKRVVLILLGILSLLLGLVLVAAGGAVAALLGQDESISTQPARLKGTGVALVAENIRIDESNIPVPEGVGTLTLSVTSPEGRDVFAGTAAPDDLDAYLTGAPYDVVVDLTSGGTARTRPVPGTQQPAPPAGQPIWTAQASGSTARITPNLDPGTALVVMNADATPGVTADVVATYRAAGAWVASWVAVGVGVVALLLGWLLLWRARVARRRRDARRAEAAAVAAPVSATTVLPSATPAAPDAPDVPAWAAAPAALSGEELAGPPTGGLVVERSADGAASVVSASEAPSAAPAPPEAGWYPGTLAAGAAVAAADGTSTEEAAPSDPADAVGAGEPAETVVPAAPTDDVSATNDGSAADGASATDSADAADARDVVDGGDDAPAVADDPVDTWHDETRPVPTVAAPVVEPAGPPGPGPEADPIYDELSSWFRDDPADGTAPDAGATSDR